MSITGSSLRCRLAAGDVYSVLRDFVTFSQAGMGIALDGIFAVILLALYPWKKAPTSQ